jgi:hypothetical protein
MDQMVLVRRFEYILGKHMGMDIDSLTGPSDLAIPAHSHILHVVTSVRASSIEILNQIVF